MPMVTARSPSAERVSEWRGAAPGFMSLGSSCKLF